MQTETPGPLLGQKFLEVSNLSKRFGSTLVVDRLSFHLAKGEIVGFVGPNGAGKSTTMKMMCGLVKPNSGTVHLDSINLQKRPSEFLEHVGVLIDGPARYPSLNAYQHLAYLTRIRGCYDRQLICSMLERVGLDPLSKKPTSKFSMGMKQRLGIAMAFVHHPQLLILDEPMNGLDPSGMIELREFIKGLSEDEGVTVFVSSHLLGEIEQICHRVLFLRNGRLVRDQVISSLGNGESEAFCLRTGDDEAVARLLEVQDFVRAIEMGVDGVKCTIAAGQSRRIAPLLVEGHIDLFEMTLQHESLEDLYLSDYEVNGHGPIR